MAVTNDKVLLPVIDLAHLEGDGRGAIIEEIERACREWGFFQIVNHGVASNVMKGAVDIALQFFTLSTEEKLNTCNSVVVDDDRPPAPMIGYGTMYCSAVDSGIFGRECVRHLFNPIEPCTDLWPDKPTSYREVISAYCQEVRSLASARLLPAISESLGVSPDLIAKSNTMQITVLNHYPPCANPDLSIGFAAHLDCTALTIVLQQEDVCGLQIRHNGEWVDAKPIKGALAIVIGDEMEVWTNGRYKAVQHRAVKDALRSRVSIATAWCEGGEHMERPPAPPP